MAFEVKIELPLLENYICRLQYGTKSHF